jgi:hypothetical protein
MTGVEGRLPEYFVRQNVCHFSESKADNHDPADKKLT